MTIEQVARKEGIVNMMTLIFQTAVVAGVSLGGAALAGPRFGFVGVVASVLAAFWIASKVGK